MSGMAKWLDRLDTAANVVGGAVLVLLVIELGFTAAVASRRLVAAAWGTPRDPREALPVYDGAPWARTLLHEEAAMRAQGVLYVPYVLWRRPEFHGTYLNIDEHGLRRTVWPADLAATPKRVFVFGGSTLWGVGVPDGSTIPSLLNAALGRDYQVFNFGEHGHVSGQELNRLLGELVRGNVPDVVIFYDGINDAYVGMYAPAEPGAHVDLERAAPVVVADTNDLLAELVRRYSTTYRALRWLSDRVTSRRAERAREAKASRDIEPRAKDTIGIWLERGSVVRALGARYGFRSLFFWQPTLLWGKKPLQPYEGVLAGGVGPVATRAIRAAYDEAEKRLAAAEDTGAHFIARIFDDETRPVYIDWAHVGPQGNRTIAAWMSRPIRESMRAARSGPVVSGPGQVPHPASVRAMPTPVGLVSRED